MNPYPLWLRVWHWTNASLFVALLITGTSMHFAEPGAPQVDFRTARLVHNSAGVLLTFGYFIFVLGNLFGRNGSFYRLEKGELRDGLVKQLRYYLSGIFVGDPHPFPHSATRKFNPLQKVTYRSVMYLLFPFLTISGWLLFFPDKLPERVLQTSGIAASAFAHSALGYALSMFMVVHIYLGTTGETPTALFAAMLRGARHDHPETRDSRSGATAPAATNSAD